MSILVEILKKHRIFAVIVALGVNHSSLADWQQEISLQLCQQWQEISAHDYACEVNFPHLSSEYQLPFCEQQWQQQLTRALKPGRNGLVVTCEKPWWQQNFAVHLKVTAEVAVLAQPVGLGHTLTAQDLSFVPHDLGTLAKDYITNAEDVIGLQVRRSQRTGTILAMDMLEAPTLIRRGDLVAIRVVRSSIKIEIQGVALENGKLGQRIRVRNSQSQNIVAAKVVSAKVVQIQ